MNGAERAGAHQAVIANTRRWLEIAVIGLNLCPFARAVAATRTIRYRVSDATTDHELKTDLIDELDALARDRGGKVETTLLIHPWALQDFHAFNDFLAQAEEVVEELALTGVLQVASFHPRYQFESTSVADVENCTNRSPYPTLHLLREASIERALATFPDPSSIYRRNIETLRRLGAQGWARLQEGFAPERDPDAHAR